MDNLPVYKIDINETDNSGIEFISLVYSPAILVKGFTFASVVMPPCHDYCKCEIIDGSWTFGSSEGGPCEFCVNNKNEYERSRRTFEFKFDEEKQMIAGPAIIPDVKIYRRDNDLGEYYVVFTKEVIEKMVEKFNQNPNPTPINLDHQDTIAPAFIKGSWIIDNPEFDKSRQYGFDLPVGTWFLEVKVTDNEFWQEQVKDKGKFGFSIEGLMGLQMNHQKFDKISFDFDDVLELDKYQSLAEEFINAGDTVYIITRRQEDTMSKAVFEVADKLNIPHSRVIFTNGHLKWEAVKNLNIDKHYDNNPNEIEKINDNTDAEGILTTKMKFQSYDDYPKAASENAARALRIRDENPDLDCGTPVGWARANQLAKGENISEETIARMSSFARHYENSKGDPSEDCGALMWLAWGGTEGIEWAGRKLEQIRTEQQDMERMRKDKKKKYEEQINNNKTTNKMKKRFKFEEYNLKDGGKISVDGELAVGSAVFLVLEDGTLEQAPEGEHILESGTTIFVDAEGLINEVRSADTTAVAEGDVAAEAEVTQPVAAQITPEEITNIVTQVMQAIDPTFTEMRAIIAELATRVETLESHEVGGIAVDEVMEKFTRVDKVNLLKTKLEALNK